MDFHAEKPIYLQIADALCEDILCGKLQAEARIPSVQHCDAHLREAYGG